MSKRLSVNVLDAPLDILATAINVSLCSAEPANFAGIAAVKLGGTTHTAGAGNGSYTKSAGDVSGRKLVIASRSGVTYTSSGIVTHIAYDNGSVLLGVTTCPDAPATAGGTTTITSHKLEIRDPS